MPVLTVVSMFMNVMFLQFVLRNKLWVYLHVGSKSEYKNGIIPTTIFEKNLTDHLPDRVAVIPWSVH